MFLRALPRLRFLFYVPDDRPHFSSLAEPLMRHIIPSVLAVTLFGATLIHAQDVPAPVGRSETTLEREGRVIAEQKAADQQKFYVQLVIIGAVAFSAVVFGWVFLIRRGPAIARRLVEMRPFDGRSNRRSLEELMIAEPERHSRRRSDSGRVQAMPEIWVADPESHSRRSSDSGRVQAIPEILVEEQAGLSRVNEPQLTPVPVADSLSGSSSSYEMQYILVGSAGDSNRMRLSRIYVLPEELAVIDNGEAGAANELVYWGGGPSGSGHGTSNVADIRVANGEVMQRLHGYELAMPMESSKSGGHFRAQFVDLCDVSIVPSTTSSSGSSASRPVGTLHFRHQKLGDFSFEIFSLVEVRGAIRLLTRALGNELRVAKEWDEIMPSYLSSL
jgi:hypothetical protein